MKNNLEKTIPIYITMQYTLIRLSGKIPIDKGWQKTQFNPNLKAVDFSNNAGIVLQDDDLVIDYDPRNDPQADTPESSLQRLHKCGGLIKTLTVITGGGGQHIYYKKSPEIKIRETLQEFPGIEFKAKGRQVVAAGSIHPETGKLYLFDSEGENTTVAEAPSDLISLISKESCNNILNINFNDNLENYDDSEVNQERYKTYLLNEKPAIEGNKGDKMTFTVAQNGKCFSLSPEKTLKLMFEHYNKRCQPPWTYDDLLTKVENAYKYSNTIPIGAFNPENQFESINEEINEFKNILKPISKVQEAKSYDWIVENLFERGTISIFFGEPGSGKTWLILALCLSLSNGTPLWNGISVEQFKVLLLEGDTQDTLLNDRLKKLGEKLNDNYFHYINGYTAENNNITLNLSDIKGRKNLEKIIKTHEPDFIVIDTLISFINDEKDAESLKKIEHELRCLAEKYKCHILICHHARKRMTGEKRKRLDQSDVIGSSILIRLASIVIGIEKNDDIENKNVKGVFGIKKTWYKYLKDFTFIIEDYMENDLKTKTRIIYDNYQPKLTKPQEAKQAIQEYIKARGLHPITRKEIENITSCSLNSIKEALKELINEGLLIENGKTKNKIFKINTEFFRPN
ncbi:MAG: AAA family ATPase [bacterium]